MKLIYYIKRKIRIYKNKIYWENYYKKYRDSFHPSDFAVHVKTTYLEENSTLLELGCGNGRDSIYFSDHNIKVHAIDQVHNEIKYLNKIKNKNNVDFIAADFTTFLNENFYNYIYSRFTIHSIDEEQELKTLLTSFKNLKSNGLFLIEVRSIKDEMFDKSVKISKNEGLTDHYRRFIEFEIFLEKLTSIGFEVLHSIESKGLAIHKDEDPYIIRIVAKKP